VRFALVPALAAALLAAACGPRTPSGYFVYEGRRGDSPAALSARFGGDARLAKVLTREAGRDPEAPFDAGERLRVPFESLEKYREVVEAFALAHEARARRAAGDYAEAVAALEAACAARPDDPAFAFELGAVRYEAGDYAGAAAALSRGRDLAPDDEEATLMLALALAEAGDVATATALLEGLAASRPDFAFGLYVLGELQLRAEDYPAGRHYLFEYLKRNAAGLLAGRAREGIKASARAEMEAAARALEKAPKEEKTKPAREAGPAE
jgi:predicted Zn-dependent protease